MSGWNACARRNPLPANRPTTCANPSTGINRTDPQPGEDEELKARRERIENAADIAQGVGSALGALDASQVGVDAADGASAVELINHAVTSLRAIRVGGTFAEQAIGLNPSMPIWATWCSP